MWQFFPTKIKTASDLLEAFGAVSHTVHRRRRAAIGLAFSKRAVYDMEGVILTNSKNLWKSIERWGSGGEVLDLRAVYLAWSADIITGLIFDNAMGMLEDYEKAVLWHQDFAAFDKYFALFKQFPSLVRFALSTPLTLARILHPQLIPFLSLYKVGRLYYFSKISRYGFDLDC